MRWRPWDLPLGDLADADMRALISPEPKLEGLFLEYKRDFENKRIARAVCSFANAEDGGTIVVGVEADKLIPTKIVGISDDGTVEEKLTNVVRSMVAPIPRYSERMVPLTGGKACLVVEVPPGFETPYVFVPNGQILMRTATSSEPLTVADRETLDRLYSRGRRGREWAQRRIAELSIPDADPTLASIAAVPHVDGGLPVGRIVHGPGAPTLLKKFRHWMVSDEYVRVMPQQVEHLDVSTDALEFGSGLERDERLLTTAWVDGVLACRLLPEPGKRLSQPSSLRIAVRNLMPIIFEYYEEDLSFEGTISLCIGWVSSSGPLVAVLDSVSLGSEEAEQVSTRAERAIERSMGTQSWDP